MADLLTKPEWVEVFRPDELEEGREDERICREFGSREGPLGDVNKACSMDEFEGVPGRLSAVPWSPRSIEPMRIELVSLALRVGRGLRPVSSEKRRSECWDGVLPTYPASMSCFFRSNTSNQVKKPTLDPSRTRA